MRERGKLNFPQRNARVGQSVYQVATTIGYDIQVNANQWYRDLIKNHRKAIINAALYRFRAKRRVRIA